MTGKCFVDTNVLAYTLDAHDVKRRDRAIALVRSLAKTGSATISTQVLQELYVVATRKLRMAPLDAKKAVHLYGSMEVVTIQPSMVHEAIDLCILNQLSVWDALIVVAAATAKCEVVWSEDMNGGQIIYGVHVVNPFDTD